MKTFSRMHWERQYKYLAAINPLIRVLLPFEKVLLSNLDSIKDDILTATSAKIHTVGFDASVPSGELQKVVLTELNDYGHSLVILCENETASEGTGFTDELLTTILAVIGMLILMLKVLTIIFGCKV